MVIVLGKITNNIASDTVHVGIFPQKFPRNCMCGYALVMATGLSRPGKSREGPGTGRDRTGPRDLEGPVVLWSRD